MESLYEKDVSQSIIYFTEYLEVAGFNCFELMCRSKHT